MSKVESADLIMKLYDLRREKLMREARNWMFTFNPTSGENIANMIMNEPENSAYFRMVTSYWDMAASFVNHGAIDAEMFNDTAGEHIAVFAKIEPHLEELRGVFESPDMLKHLEKTIKDTPDGMERVKKMQEWFAKMGEQNTETETKTEAATQ